MADWIVEEVLQALSADAPAKSITIRLGRPYKINDREWACAVAVDGLYARLHDVHGVSSLQALCLAASLVRSLLTAFIEDGGQLLSVDTGHSVGIAEIAACFSGIGSASRRTV